MAQRRRKPRIAARRGVRWWLVPLAFLVVAGGGVALAAWPDAIDRWVHPERYRTSGNAMMAADAYVAAADRVLARGEALAVLDAPRGQGPVMASTADGGAAVFLDPPTARVLGVARSGGWYDGAVRWIRRHGRQMDAPIVAPALGVDRVIALAGKLGGARWVSVEWPTDRRADWVVSYPQGRVLVADDAGGAVVVRAKN